MKPSEIIINSMKTTKKTETLYLDDLLSIVDQMAEDIKRLKFLVKYICPADVVSVHNIKERKWEE
jgi:hypothetical protein